MTKLSHLRKRMKDEYHSRNLPQAAALGEALLREHLLYGNASPGYANDLFNVALVYDEMGDLERAAAIYSASARHISARGGRPCHAIVMYSLSDEDCRALAMRFNNLAGVIARMGDYEQAQDMYKWVQALNIRLQSENTPAQSDNLYNQGNAAADADKKDEALRLHGKALIRRKQEDARDDILHSLHSLAHIYEESGDYDKAISFAISALDYAQGGVHAGACYYLARLYEADGQYEKALALYEQVLDLIPHTGHMRRDYMAVLSRRAYLTGKLGNCDEAIKLLGEVFDIYNSLTNLDLEIIDPTFYANCLKNMAVLNKSIGETDLAEDYMLKSILSRKAVGGDIMPDVCFLMGLHLEREAYDKVMDVLVYALALADEPGSPDATTVIDAVMESFSNAENKHMILTAIKEIRSTEKLRPILDKWRLRGGFL